MAAKKKTDELTRFIEALTKGREAVRLIESGSSSDQILGLIDWEAQTSLISREAFALLLSQWESTVASRAEEVRRRKVERTGTLERRNAFLRAVRESGVAGFAASTVVPGDHTDRVGPFELRYPTETGVEIVFLGKVLRKLAYPSTDDIIAGITAVHSELLQESDAILPKVSGLLTRADGCSAPELKAQVEGDGRKWKDCEAGVQYLMGRLISGGVSGVGRMSIAPPDLAQQKSALEFRRLDTVALLRAIRFRVEAPSAVVHADEVSPGGGEVAPAGAASEEDS